MRKYNIKPEIEVFDTAMLWSAFRLAEKGEISAPLHINLVMGMPGSQPASVKALLYLYDHLPKDCTWNVTIIGKEHLKLSVIAMALGGNVRVGLEDNIYHVKGVLATNLGLLTPHETDRTCDGQRAGYAGGSQADARLGAKT